MKAPAPKLWPLLYLMVSLSGVLAQVPPNPRNPEAPLSQENVAQMMIEDAWSRASQENFHMLHILIQGHNYHAIEPEQWKEWNQIDYRQPPKKIGSNPGAQETFFQVKTRGNQAITVIYSSKNPHQVRLQGKP
jgi:hypothetical protein